MNINFVYVDKFSVEGSICVEIFRKDIYNKKNMFNENKNIHLGGGKEVLRKRK